MFWSFFRVNRGQLEDLGVAFQGGKESQASLESQ